MESLKDLIVKHKEKFPEFEYYIPIIEQAQQHQEKQPDITIECCNSLTQGISKTIIFSVLSSFLVSLSRVPNVDIKKLIKNESVHVQFSTALNVLETGISDSDFFNLIEEAYSALQAKKENNKDVSKIRKVFSEAVKISTGRKEEEHVKFLVACEELLSSKKNPFFGLIQEASSSLNSKPATDDASFKRAIRLLSEQGDILEIDFIRACNNLVNKIANFRNDRGDISHGREVPKTLQSDVNLSRLIVEITESLLRYTLASFFVLDLEKQAKAFEQQRIEEAAAVVIEYKDNPEFNDFLDEKYQYPGKLFYSQALYELYYEDYGIQLQLFLDEQELLEE